MAQQKPLDKLMHSEMSRREFLGFLGTAVLGIIGITGIIKGLSGAAGHQSGAGYGASAYGGGDEASPRRRL